MSSHTLRRHVCVCAHLGIPRSRLDWRSRRMQARDLACTSHSHSSLTMSAMCSRCRHRGVRRRCTALRRWWSTRSQRLGNPGGFCQRRWALCSCVWRQHYAAQQNQKCNAQQEVSQQELASCELASPCVVQCAGAGSYFGLCITGSMPTVLLARAQAQPPVTPMSEVKHEARRWTWCQCSARCGTRGWHQSYAQGMLFP